MKNNKILFSASSFLLVLASAFISKSRSTISLYTRTGGTDVTGLVHDCSGDGTICTIGSTQVVTIPGGNVVGHTAFQII